MELETQIKSIADAVQKLQEVNDGKFKAHEGTQAEQSAKLADMIAKMNEVAQKQEAIETALARPGVANADEAKNEYKAAFDAFVRKGDEMQLKALISGSDPDGGYFIPQEISDQISTIVFESSPIRQLANVMTISSDSLDMLIDDNQFTTGWVGEIGSRAVTSTPEVGQINIPVHEMYSNPTASQRLLDDAKVNLEQWIAQSVARDLNILESTAFVSGNGVNKPMGFLSYSAWASAGVYERNKVEQVVSGSGSALTADGLIDLKGALKEQYQGNAVFVMKRSAWTAVCKLKDSANQYLLGIGIGGLNNAQQATLLGKPIVFANDMPAVASNALSVAYGDFRQGYTIVDRFGIRTLRDPFSSKPYVTFYTTKRVGGAVTNFEAIKIQKVST